MLQIISAFLILPLLIQFFLLIFGPGFFLYWTVFLGLIFILFKFFPEDRKRLLFESLGFLFLFFLIYLIGQNWIYFYPSGEHVRDYALLSASIANPLNPQEPWMSNEANHYYIYWYKWAASLSYLFKINGEQTYVLSFCLSFAMYIKLTYLFFRRIIKIEYSQAMALSLLPAFISNFEGILFFFRENSYWWGPSRVINGAITEFPVWTFLQADYHPHFPSLGLAPLFLILSFYVLRLNAPRFNRLVYLSLLFVLFYRVYMIANPWDVLFLAFAFGGIIIKEFFFENNQDFELSKWQNLVLLLMSFFIISSTFLYPPVLQTNIKFAFVTNEVGRSTLKELFAHWGVWFSSFLSIMFVSLHGKKFKLLNSTHLYFIILSSLLVFLPEFVFIDDPYGPPNERMNFIFKLYMPAWTIVGITVSIFFERIFLKKSFWLFFLSLFLIGNLFNFKVFPHRIHEFSNLNNRLDLAEKEHVGIKTLIQKFREYPRGTTIQSSKTAYDYTSFIATLANKDLYLGWINHLMLFVPDYSILMNRQSFIRAIYEESNCLKKQEYLDQIDAKYLVLSGQELRDYPASISTDFSCLNKILSEGENTIYQVH